MSKCRFLMFGFKILDSETVSVGILIFQIFCVFLDLFPSFYNLCSGCIAILLEFDGTS